MGRVPEPLERRQACDDLPMVGAATDWITAISTAAVAVVALFFGWTEWRREHERDKSGRRARALLLAATMDRTLFRVENEGDGPFLDLKLYFYVVNGHAVPEEAADVVRELSDGESPFARTRTLDALAEMVVESTGQNPPPTVVAEFSCEVGELRGRGTQSEDLSESSVVRERRDIPSDVPYLVLPFWYLEFRDDRDGRWTTDESGRISEGRVQRSVESEFSNAMNRAASKWSSPGW